MSDMVNELKCKSINFYSGRGMAWSVNKRDSINYGGLNYHKFEDKQENGINRDSARFKLEVEKQLTELRKGRDK